MSYGTVFKKHLEMKDTGENIQNSIICIAVYMIHIATKLACI